MDPNAKLIEARTAQLRSAVTINDILTQALTEAKATIEKALAEAENIRKQEVARAMNG